MRGGIVETGLTSGTFYIHGIDGHSYHVNKRSKGGRLSLRCLNYGNRLTCRARANMYRDGRNFVPGRKHRHNHPKSRNFVHERRFRTRLLNQCRQLDCAQYSLKQLYFKVKREMREYMHLPRLALVNVPYVKLRQSMQLARGHILPRIPHTLSDLAHILEDPDYEFLTKTLDKEDSTFLGKCGQSASGTRCLIFASKRHLRYLSTKKYDIMSDATFSSVPGAIGAAQIWTIIHLRRHHATPLVRVLMQTKLQECYEEALRAIRAVIPDFALETVMCDFESAQANAWQTVFPLIRVTGCFFHSSKVSKIPTPDPVGNETFRI
ncbi:tRNA-2-methylthio-N(6)-dimethylallyladenosine synthase [Frankliniella fusca]|uniref:tRNA-2-methylthio-N(6)-dimethylallyladenosine synthase n=1 Tax=Frankliniella fusca TaxID=407009 RepID=A0AAE1LL80_9NEOP|nr:tRNA-2-methylthio-N(6)-dimethylallyladenosine synthase [Frankliniella fusca]